jgi:hypothetical protein
MKIKLLTLIIFSKQPIKKEKEIHLLAPPSQLDNQEEGTNLRSEQKTPDD